jgi:hypothetical protein
MIKVKIVEGRAVGVYQLDAKNKFTAFWNRLFLIQFQIVYADDNKIPAEEGNMYWAWSLGSRRIILLEEIHP